MNTALGVTDVKTALASEPADIGTVPPSDDVRASLVSFLEADGSRLGQVYRGQQRGLDDGAIAAELGVNTPRFVWTNARIARALLDGNLPTAPTVAQTAAQKFRSILKSPELDAQVRLYLQPKLRELERRAKNKVVAAPAAASQKVRFGREDCEIFLRYPKPVHWDPENVRPEDQTLFKSIWERLSELANSLLRNTRVNVLLSADTSHYTPNGTSPTHIWCCVRPTEALHKSYALQVALIVSASGAELCLCLGAGRSQLKGPRLADAQQAFRQLKARLGSVPPDVVHALEDTLPDDVNYRKSWRQPTGTRDFESLTEWLAHAAGPDGAGASISRNITVEKLDQLGPQIENEVLALADAAAPLVDYCYLRQPPSPKPKHDREAAATFDAHSLEARAAAGPHPLEIDRQVYRSIVAAIQSGKHVILTGPPGTAKTTLAELTCQLASDAGLCTGHRLTTATSDWTTYETIGGLRPAGSDGSLQFREGLFLEAIRARRWLVVDELNRSNFDRAFGQLFTVLSGQSVVLPYEDPGSGKPVAVVLEGRASGYSAADYSILLVPAKWRIIATMNVFDKSLLFEMSFALMRRFAFIEVASPPKDAFATVWRRELAGLPRESMERVDRILMDLFELRRIKDIGPAVFIDMAKFARMYTADNVDTSSGKLAFQLFYSYLLPQFEGISTPQGRELFKIIRQLVENQQRDRLRTIVTDVLGVDLPSAQMPGDDENEDDQQDDNNETN